MAEEVLGKTSKLRIKVIDYLNVKIGSKYRPHAIKNKVHLDVRIKEKYTFEEFKIVIDHKCDEWLHDRYWKKFLRPETLFGTKMESYLNDALVKVEDWDMRMQKFLEKNLGPDWLSYSYRDSDE